MAGSDSARVFITGGSSGIGAALAHHYAARGAVLGLVARQIAPLQQVAAALGVPCAVYPCDVRDAAAMREAAADFIGRHGCPDIVIANAGVSYGTLTEAPEDYEAFRALLDINVCGLVATFQPFIDPMRARGGGALVGIASVAGYRGLPGAEAYCASKAAAIAYLESLRVRMRPAGVRVVTVCPGYVDTPLTRGNPYPMPFLTSAESMAARIARVTARRRRYAVIPWPMAIVARLLRLAPDWLYDRAFARAPHKPRLRA